MPLPPPAARVVPSGLNTLDWMPAPPTAKVSGPPIRPVGAADGQDLAVAGVAGEGVGVHWREPEQEAGIVGHGPVAGEPRQDIVAGSNRPRTGMLSDGLALPGET